MQILYPKFNKIVTGIDKAVSSYISNHPKVTMKFSIIVLASVFAIASGGLPWLPDTRPDQWWHDRHFGFVENTLNNNGSINVLFYGDSITERWGDEGRETYEQYYAPLGTANYGIGGDRIEHVLWRIRNGEVTDNLSPKICVIKIGTNNILANDEAAIALGVVFDVMELRERLPNTKILLLGVLPKDHEEMTGRTSAINDVIRHLDNGRTIRYLDMKEHFFRGNNLVREMYLDDLVHLSPAGYRKWAEVMNPLFSEMLESN